MSNKRPSLAGLARPKPGTANGAPSGAAADRPAARVSGISRASRRAPADPAAAATAEEDVHAMTVRISKATSKALKIRAIDEDRPVVDLIRDAIDDYLRRHRG